MKNKITKFALLTFLITLPLVSFSQTEKTTTIDTTTIDTTSVDTTSNKDILETKINDLQKSLKEIKKIIESDKGTSTTVGIFKLFKVEQIDVYVCDGACKSKTKRLADFKVNIEQVIIDISNGVITDIQVETKKNRTFTNPLAPIEVNKFERCDLLTFKHGLNKYYIQTCDFINFQRNGYYIADDNRFVLTKKDETKALAKNTGINSVINVKIYTDLLGTFGGEDNGLIQTEANFKTPITTTNLKNTPFFLFHYFTANLSISKFDNKFKYTNLLYTKNDTIVSGMDTTYIKADTTFSKQILNQRSWFNFDIGFNILSMYLSHRSKNNLSLDFISGFSLSNFTTNSDTLIVALPYIGFNPSMKIIPAPNIGIILSSQFVWQFCPQLESKGYGASKFIISPELELFWNPSKSPGSRIFTRIKYVTMGGEKEPFFLWQLGYNLSLSEIVNKKLENK
jgi:hypothetical protein